MTARKVNLHCVILRQKEANHIERCLGQNHLKLKGAPQFSPIKTIQQFRNPQLWKYFTFQCRLLQNIDLIEQIFKK